MADNILRYISYIIIIVIAFFITNWLAYIPPFTPFGLVLPAQLTKTYPATTADQVKLYTDNMPLMYTTLGIVHVEKHYTQLSQQAEMETVQYAQQLAAQVGANGLLFELKYDPPGSSPAGLNKYILEGLAIYSDK